VLKDQVVLRRMVKSGERKVKGSMMQTKRSEIDKMMDRIMLHTNDQ